MAGFLIDRYTVCPPWCELSADHVLSSDHYDHKHVCVVAEMRVTDIEGIRSAGEKPVTVQVQAWVDWDRREWPPVIRVGLSCSEASGDEQDLTSNETRELAAAWLRPPT
jgi:hypothetical protein